MTKRSLPFLPLPIISLYLTISTTLAKAVDIQTKLTFHFYYSLFPVMVMKTFRTDALEGLCTHEQLDLLNSISTLRSQGISHYISLPQIIVCGDQSSGKSSVLEAISGVSFPVKSSLCT